jgi:hypothetical protein
MWASSAIASSSAKGARLTDRLAVSPTSRHWLATITAHPAVPGSSGRTWSGRAASSSTSSSRRPARYVR